MTQRAMLLKSAATQQRDVLAALADDAEECGEPDLAAGFRWLAEHGRWPALRSRPGGAYWYWCCGVRRQRFWDNWELPAETYPGPIGPAASFGECLEGGARAVGRWLLAGAGPEGG